jgi:hypothetical protein
MNYLYVMFSKRIYVKEKNKNNIITIYFSTYLGVHFVYWYTNFILQENCDHTLSIIDGTYTDSWMTESNEEEMCSLYSNYGNHDDHMLMEPVDMIVEVSSAD